MVLGDSVSQPVEIDASSSLVENKLEVPTLMRARNSCHVSRGQYFVLRSSATLLASRFQIG